MCLRNCMTLPEQRQGQTFHPINVLSGPLMIRKTNDTFISKVKLLLVQRHLTKCILETVHWYSIFGPKEQTDVSVSHKTLCKYTMKSFCHNVGTFEKQMNCSVTCGHLLQVLIHLVFKEPTVQ